MRLAYLDCFAGIAGDMFLAALVDAGVSRSLLEDATAALNLNASLRFETVDRSGIAATKVHVLAGDHLADEPAPQSIVDQQTAAPPYTRHPHTQHQHGIGHTHPHGLQQDPALYEPDVLEPTQHDDGGRSLSTIRDLIQSTTLPAEVKALSLRTFHLLGRSEARIHNVDIEDIHFHEVGAIDAIVDIVVSAAGIVSLGVDAWHCSPVNVGGGTVRCAHGIFPVPAPATADLLRGAPTYSAHLQKELVTPTGAALLRALAPTFGPQPAMAVDRIGYGAGTRNPPGFPNVLRLSLGQADTASTSPGPFASAVSRPTEGNGTEQTVAVLETALDDATPQLLAYVSEQALAHGALDVMLTPVIMKKGRPGTLLTLLTNQEDSTTFEQFLLRETTTLGVRIRHERRVCLDRSHITVATPYGPIRIKLGAIPGGGILNAHPEFEDCRTAAAAHNIPLKHVQAAAIAAYQQAESSPA